MSDEELSKFFDDEYNKYSKLFKGAVVKVLKDVRMEIEDIDGITEIGAQILDEVSGIIDRKIKEIKHECSACTHSDEVDGEYCYECIKDNRDNFEAEVITRGNCMMCGKELTKGLFFCKECEAKQVAEKEEE